MKSLNEVISCYPKYKSIITWVYDDIGEESIQDVNNHGIDGGYGSFVYYSDTTKFWRKFKSIILKMMQEDCDSYGESNILGFCLMFGCFKGYDSNEIAKALYAPYNDDNMQIYNGFAWYAAETICRWFED